MSRRKQLTRPGRACDTPPWCYWHPGMAPEAAALVAARAHRITDDIALLCLLQMMTRHAKKNSST